MNDRPAPHYPFAAIVGQRELRLGLLLNVVDPSVGGVMIMGHRGCAKSTAVRALADVLPPREKRGLVLVDPPFEHKDEMAHMAEAAMAAINRWPTGTFVFWRPLKDLWAAERFDVGFAEWLFEEKGFAPEDILRAELWVRDLDTDGKLAGAGVVVINPPYTLEADLAALLPWLCATLAHDEGAGWRLDGAVAEDSLSVEEF